MILPFILLFLAPCLYSFPDNPLQTVPPEEPSNTAGYPITRIGASAQIALLNPEYEICIFSSIPTPFEVTIWSCGTVDGIRMSDLKGRINPIGRGNIRLLVNMIKQCNTRQFYIHAFTEEKLNAVPTLGPCRKDYETQLGGYKTFSMLRGFPTDQTVHVPFSMKTYVRVSGFVDLSSMLEKTLRSHKEQRVKQNICMVSNSREPVAVNLSRCPEEETFEFTLNKTNSKEFFHETFINHLSENRHNTCLPKSPINHLWISVSSSKSVDVGEIIFYPCIVGKSLLKEHQGIAPHNNILTLPPIRKYDYSFFLQPKSESCQRIHIKSIIDQAVAVPSARVRFALTTNAGVSIEYSRCIDSKRYTLTEGLTQEIVLLEYDVLQMNNLLISDRCQNEDDMESLYIHFTSMSSETFGNIVFDSYDEKHEDVIVVPFVLKPDQMTTQIADISNLMIPSSDRSPSIYVNVSGRVKVSLSKCKYGPRTILVEVASYGIQGVGDGMVDFVKSNLDTTPCSELEGIASHEAYVHVHSFGSASGYVMWKKSNISHKLDESAAFEEAIVAANRHMFVKDTPGVIDFYTHELDSNEPYQNFTSDFEQDEKRDVRFVATAESDDAVSRNEKMNDLLIETATSGFKMKIVVATLADEENTDQLETYGMEEVSVEWLMANAEHKKIRFGDHEMMEVEHQPAVISIKYPANLHGMTIPIIVVYGFPIVYVTACNTFDESAKMYMLSAERNHISLDDIGAYNQSACLNNSHANDTIRLALTCDFCGIELWKHPRTLPMSAFKNTVDDPTTAVLFSIIVCASAIALALSIVFAIGAHHLYWAIRKYFRI